MPFLASDLGEIARMLDTGAGMAGEVVPLEGDEVDVSGMAMAITRLAMDGAYYSAVRDRVVSAAAKFDPALLAERHDLAYREALAGDEALRAIA